MPLEIVRNDITKMRVDAIVNAANNSLLGGGGVDGAIHRAAGPALLEECRKLGGCETGQAKITGGYNLPSKHVIHTVGPVWHGGMYGERMLLAACYANSLALAKAHDCESVAFPLISAGAYGYPREDALKVAVDTINAFLNENDMTVYIVVFDRNSFAISEDLIRDVRAYIDDHYVDMYGDFRNRSARMMEERALWDFEECCEPKTYAEMPAKSTARKDMAASGPVSLADALKNLDESFSRAVLRMIDEKGMTDVECYKRANMDRKLFSKIRKDENYKPSKYTAVALAIALKLDLDETNALLRKAGLALSGSSKFDVIIEYFIQNRNYDIHEINQTLFYFDQSLLGV